MRTILNQKIPIMVIIKSNIRLTTQTGLNHSESQLLMVVKEIINKLSDRLEGYLLSRKGINADDGKVVVVTSRRPQDRTSHRLAAFNLHSGATTREERF